MDLQACHMRSCGHRGRAEFLKLDLLYRYNSKRGRRLSGYTLHVHRRDTGTVQRQQHAQILARVVEQDGILTVLVAGLAIEEQN